MNAKCYTVRDRTCSPYNFHFKVLLVDTYRSLGMFQGGIMRFNELEVKQIQLDSLSWLLLPGCKATGFFNEVQFVCFNPPGLFCSCPPPAPCAVRLLRRRRSNRCGPIATAFKICIGTQPGRQETTS